MNDRPAQIRRILALWREALVSLLGRSDARGGRAEHERDAVRSVALARKGHAGAEIIERKSEPREPIVAAVPDGKLGWQRPAFEPVDPPNPGLKRLRREVIR